MANHNDTELGAEIAEIGKATLHMLCVEAGMEFMRAEFRALPSPPSCLACYSATAVLLDAADTSGWPGTELNRRRQPFQGWLHPWSSD